MGFHLKSAGDPPAASDGKRYLIETFWPEGKEAFYLSPYRWLREEVAPSYLLQSKAEVECWPPERFRQEYRKELERREKASWLEQLRSEAEKDGVTLLYSSPSPDHSPARTLKDFLERR